MGSILIGVLLVIVAFTVGREVHALLLGEADIKTGEAIQDFVTSQEYVIRVFNVIAVNHGQDVMIAIKAELEPALAVWKAVEIINQMEKTIKENHPRVRWVFFEIDNTDK